MSRQLRREKAGSMDESPKRSGWRAGWAALFAVAAAMALAAGTVGCATDRPVSVKYGTSQLYSAAEMAQAVEVIQADFATLSGCRLYSLTYAGDERCRQELEYANRDSAPEERYAACIVFDSVFRSPPDAEGAWEANALYYWSWILARTANGAWVVINKGYA